VSAPNQSEQAMNAEITEALVDHILRYGGKCRECGDNFNICMKSGMSCDPDEARRTIRFVLKAREHFIEYEALSANTVAPERLWLWRNFVDGKPEYWAFDNPYPCEPCGDPMTLGEPCGWAILKQSENGRPDVPIADVEAAIKRPATPTDDAELVERLRSTARMRLANPDTAIEWKAADRIEALSIASKPDGRGA